MLDTPQRARDRAKGQPAATSFSEDARVFLGDRDNPLLAPRGVHLVSGRLIVADTGQNRVFIWNELPTDPHAVPDVVLGQVATKDTERNAGGRVSGSSLMYPSGLWSDGERLVVCDAWNHRVLIWNRWPTEHGQPADVVVGQPDFTANEPNVAGVGAVPGARTLNWPYGVDSDGERLYVADTGNRRILIFNQFPTQNYAAADAVFGKRAFDDRDYDPAQPIWPYSIKINPAGGFAVADTQYYRILLYRDLSDTEPVIIGQERMDANGQNQFRWFPEANTLNWCYDTCFHDGVLYVADTGNSRVLRFTERPTENNQAADALVGQADFTVGIENRNSIEAKPESFYWPFHLSADGDTLAVADTGNHRIVLHTLKSLL